MLWNEISSRAWLKNLTVKNWRNASQEQGCNHSKTMQAMPRETTWNGQARLCCNGSEDEAPILHASALTHSSCVEHPIQQSFFAMAGSKNLKANAQDLETLTHTNIDDQCAEWHENKHDKKPDGDHVPPAWLPLQGHPESGWPWEACANGISKSDKLNVKTAMHGETVCTTASRTGTVHMLR